ncbi:MAG: 6-phosphofructokinase [Nitrospirota bacterium]
MKRIGIITSGGDCGGLNAVIKGAARMAAALGAEMVVIPNGYAGLYNLVEMERVVLLTQERLNRIDATRDKEDRGRRQVRPDQEGP